jgi:hypothetical protein
MFSTIYSPCLTFSMVHVSFPCPFLPQPTKIVPLSPRSSEWCVDIPSDVNFYLAPDKDRMVSTRIS